VTYQIALFPMTLSDPHGHSPTASLSRSFTYGKRFQTQLFVQQQLTRFHFNRHSASRGPSAALAAACCCRKARSNKRWKHVVNARVRLTAFTLFLVVPGYIGPTAART